MSAEDVAHALMAMDDRELRVRVAGGDLAAVGADDLPEHEQQLLVAAAASVPGDDEVEVAGFQMVSFAPPYVPVGPAVGGKPLQFAMQYAQDGIADQTLAAKFHQWSVNVTAQGSW
jgi:hypothetical protein